MGLYLEYIWLESFHRQRKLRIRNRDGEQIEVAL